MDAPLGTAARANVPSSRSTSTSTVGLPRESRISRAPTASMIAMPIRLSAARGRWRAAPAGRIGPSARTRPRGPRPTRRTASRSACSGSTPERRWPRRRARGGGRRGLPPGPPRPEDRSRRVRNALEDLGGEQQGRAARRRSRRTASGCRSRPVGRSARLICCHCSFTSAADRPVGGVGAEDVRVAAVHLLADAARDVVEGELARLLGDDRVEVDLQQKVAELLAEVVGVAGVDRLDRLGGLLLEVARERAMGLLPLPGAVATQPPHVGEEVEQRLALGHRQPQTCEGLQRRGVGGVGLRGARRRPRPATPAC